MNVRSIDLVVSLPPPPNTPSSKLGCFAFTGGGNVSSFFVFSADLDSPLSTIPPLAGDVEDGGSCGPATRCCGMGETRWWACIEFIERPFKRRRRRRGRGRKVKFSGKVSGFSGAVENFILK